MTTFVLIPGAGGQASYWNRVVPDLQQRGHEAIAVDIHEDDPRLGLPEYADIVDAAIDEHTDVVLVAQSMGAFTAPVVANRRPVRMIVLVNAMIPVPGETPGEWWDATGQTSARIEAETAAGRDPEFDLETVFLHDIPDDVKQQMYAEGERGPADTPFGQPCEFDRWPDVAIHVVVGRDDRLFPADFQVRLARTRLGVEADVVPGGHLVALANPTGLIDRLVGYLDAG